MAALHALSFMNSNRDEKAHPEPFELPMPWPKTYAAEEVTADELAELQASLLSRSAFAN